MRLFRCRWEPEARGPLGATLPSRETGLADPSSPRCLGRSLPPAPPTASLRHPRSGPALRKRKPGHRQDVTQTWGAPPARSPPPASLLRPTSESPCPPRPGAEADLSQLPVQDPRLWDESAPTSGVSAEQPAATRQDSLLPGTSALPPFAPRLSYLPSEAPHSQPQWERGLPFPTAARPRSRQCRGALPPPCRPPGCGCCRCCCRCCGC